MPSWLRLQVARPVLSGIGAHHVIPSVGHLAALAGNDRAQGWVELEPAQMQRCKVPSDEFMSD